VKARLPNFHPAGSSKVMAHFARFQFLLLFSTSLALAQQPSSVPRDDFWVPDGPVNAVVETNGVIYIGGLFGYVSPNSGTGGAFDLLSGASVPGFPRFAGAIEGRRSRSRDAKSRVSTRSAIPSQGSFLL